MSFLFRRLSSTPEEGASGSNSNRRLSTGSVESSSGGRLRRSSSECAEIRNECTRVVDQLTADQIEEFKEAFALFDKDGDGTITAKELSLVMNGLGQSPSAQEIDDMINEVDSDGNGSIEFSEFLLLIANRLRTEDMQDELKDAFKVFDKNGDGYLSREELQDVLKNVGDQMSDQDIEEFLHEADRDGNGKVDYEEFASMMLSAT